ncbi:PTS fructose transporter subunit IIABC [Collinsella ihumii]|uniref:PTS fructose transporter subunit IIABC n=1 Tax=Collinsella ihumii TaxID=1720204 RepID=UPI00082ABDE1|nr:fructose-specific PTS transporter subunit EIIC [Collinsella ihumii]
MKITELFSKNGVKLGVAAATQADAIDVLVDLHDASGTISDREKYRAAVLERESQFSTAVGEGVAIPHAKTDAVVRPGLAAITVPAGVDWNAPDGKPSDLIFMIAAPEGQANVHLEVLAKLSMLLMHEDFADALRAAKTVDEFLSVIDTAEAAHDAEQAEKEKKAAEAKAAREAAAAAAAGTDAAADPGLPQVLAITACPTGIAHTYMAAENLEKVAEQMGVTIKVETQGSVGTKNALTAEEIAACRGIIIAADKGIELSRFNGKPLYSTNVSAGINDAERLINIIMNGEAPICHAEGGSSAPAASASTEGIGSTVYKHLMNGVSHMLPFVVGGGILMAISFLLDQAGMGTSSYGSSTPLAAFFNLVGNQAFNFMLPILAGFISMSIADRPGLAPGFVGGWIAKQGFTLGYLSSAMDADAQAALISGGFIAALFAGFAAGYLTYGLERLCDKLPDSLEGIKPVLLYPLIAIFLIGLVMLALNPIFAAINSWLTAALNGMGTTNLVLLGAVVAGMMSVDMGGPFNKAAYVFGTAMLADGTTTGQIIMASVMIGGMVPPLAIALSTTIFKNRWTFENRKAGIVNYIMGLSFITEGAIPYAAADPGRVLPSCIVGAAIAGAMSAGFGCTSPAPHGGAWVIAVIGNPVMYLLALVVGAVVACLILSFLKKPLPAEVSGLER